MNSSNTWGLPAYSPAVNSPHYTREPRAGEERLQISGRLPVSREQTGVFYVRAKHAILALINQVPNCKRPAYGRGGLIQGVVSPLKVEGITSISIKLEAVLAVAMTSIILQGHTLIPLFSKQEILFEKLSSLVPNQGTGAERCPSTLPFAVRIPMTYSYEGLPRELPPTYTDFFKGIPEFAISFVNTKGLRLDSRYNLHVTISREGAFGKGKRTVLTQPIVFTPRSRPAQPALPPSLSFLSTVKSSPEEWKLFEAETGVREGHEGTAVIRSALLLPQSQVFPITHAIPFHLQLSCTSSKTLARYAPHSSQDPQTNSPHSFTVFLKASSIHTRDWSLSNHLFSKPLRKDNGPSDLLDSDTVGLPHGVAKAADIELSATKLSGRIYISVQRHVAVEFKGQWLLLKRTVSTSTFKRCPIMGSEGDNNSLAWEGHIHLEGKSKCGGFGGPSVRVKDYILLSVIPPHSDHAPLREIQHLIPIRLTTDSYSEDILIPGMELAYHAI